MLRKIVLLAALAVAMVLSANAKAVTYESLLVPGAQIQVFDKIFYGFSPLTFNVSGGAQAPLASQVFVNTTTIVNPFTNETEWGLVFADGWNVGPGQTLDMQFDFYVKVAPGYNYLITDNTLTATGSVYNGGTMFIAETAETVYKDPVTNKPILLADKLNILSPVGGTLYDHQDYKLQVKEVHVKKNVFLSGGTAGFAALSDFTQTFSQTIPLPTAAWAGLGLLGILGVARKVRAA